MWEFCSYADGRREDYPHRRMIKVRLNSMRFDAARKLDDVIKTVEKWKKTYDGAGYVSLMVDLEYEPGNEDTLPSNRLELIGTRLETLDDMRRRLRAWAGRFLMEHRTHYRMVIAHGKYLAKTLALAQKYADPHVLKNWKEDMLKICREELG